MSAIQAGMSAGAKPLAFFPGLLCDSRLWAPQIAGLGATIQPWVADFTRDESIAGMASRALEECPFAKFSLAGLSMGGYVALEVMRQAPGRVERLALLDTQARSDTAEARERRFALIELAENGRLSEVTERMMPLFLHASRLNDPVMTGLCRDMATAVGKDAFLRQQKAIMERIDSRDTLWKIRCPTLVLCGDHDLLTPVDRHQELARNIEGSRLVVVPGCGHMSTIEVPDAVSRALRDWLEVQG